MNIVKSLSKKIFNRGLVALCILLILFISGCTQAQGRLMLFNDLNQQKVSSYSLVLELKENHFNKKNAAGKEVVKSYTMTENNFNSLISQLKADVMSGRNVSEVNLVYKPLLEKALFSANEFSKKVSEFRKNKVPAAAMEVPSFSLNNLGYVAVSLKAISEIVKDIRYFLEKNQQVSPEQRNYFLSELDKFIWEDFDKIK